MKQLRITLFSLCLLCCGAAAAQQTVDMTTALTDGTYYYRLYSAPVALDFSTADGVDAYVVTRKRLVYGGDPSVTLTRVSEAPAQTGLLVRTAEARAYSVAEAGADVSSVGRNALIPVSEQTDAADLIELSSENAIVVTVNPAVLAVDETTGAVGFKKVDLPSELKRLGNGQYALEFARDQVVLEAGSAYLTVDNEAGEIMGNNDVVPLVLLDEPEVLPTADNILATKTIVEQAEDYDELLVNFHDAVVTAVSLGSDDQGDAVVVEDATGAIRLFRVGIADRLQPGDVLNGTLALYIDYSPFGSALIASERTEETFSQLTIGHTEVTPLAIDDDNIEDYVLDYDWRLVRFSGDNTFQLSSEGEPRVYLDILGDQVPVFDVLQTQLPDPENGQTVEVVGYLFDLLGSLYLQPLDYIIDGVSTGVQSSRAAAAPGVVFDLQGRRVSPTHRGLVISGGRKVLRR